MDADQITTSPTFARVLSRLDEARNKLVDRNLRNKLIHTSLNNNRARHLRIWDELSDQVFECVLAQKKSMGFLFVPDPKDAEETGPEDTESLLQPFQDLDGGVLSIDPNRHADTDLQTKHSRDALEKKLRSLYYEATEYEEEQGVNILYLALGFLKWFESPNSDEERFAPLILIPVELKREGAKDRYKVCLRDEDMFTNVSLKLWLKEQHSIDLPEISDDEKWTPSEYFTLVNDAISGSQRWEVLENEILLGLFSFSKFLLWRDLDPANWPKGFGLLEHPILQKLLGSSFDDAPIKPDPPIVPAGELIDDHFRPHELVFIVEADSSQTEAIQSAVAGHDLVIQGPPGTGKSQTITNIISAATHQGKKVLFVAEKMAALEVVHQRLVGSELGPICLELHSRKATKTSVLKQLDESSQLAHQPAPAMDRLDQLEGHQNILNRHARRLNDVDPVSGFTPYEVLGAISKIYRDGISPPDLSVPNSKYHTKRQLLEYVEELEQLVGRLQVSGIPARHPWRASKREFLNPLDQDRLNSLLEKTQNVIKELITAASIVDRGLSLQGRLETSTTVDSFMDILFVHEQLEYAPSLDPRLATSTHIEQEQKL